MKNMYKAMTVAKPDLVMVQVSPDLLLDNFEQYPEKHTSEDGWVFDEQAYLKQLVRNGTDVYPSLKMKVKL